MYARLLGIPDDPLSVFLAISLFGVLLYFASSGLSYFVMFRWKRTRVHPDYVPDRAMNRKAILWSMYSLAGNALLTMPFHVLIAAGYSQIYWDPLEYGWGWLLASLLLYLAFTETAIYWIHRALHQRWLYKHIHKPHHDFRAPTPWVSVAFHPLDSFSQALPHHLCAFLFPVNIYLYLGMVTIVTLWSVAIHDRYSWIRGNIVNHCDHHTIHHWYFRDNYGQFFTFWDRLCGTYRDPAEERLLGKVPAAILPRRGIVPKREQPEPIAEPAE